SCRSAQRSRVGGAAARRARGVLTSSRNRLQRWNGHAVWSSPARRQGIGAGEGGTLYLSELFLSASPHRSKGGHRGTAIGVATNGSDDQADTLKRSHAPWLGQSRGDSQICRAHRESVTP